MKHMADKFNISTQSKVKQNKRFYLWNFADPVSWLWNIILDYTF